MSKLFRLGLTGLFCASLFVSSSMGGESKSKKFPYLEETPDGKNLVLPDDLDEFLSVEFPKFRLPKLKDFNPAMLSYYNSNLLGIHPAITWGDFNNDKKLDYALLVITNETKWGPLIELVILNGISGKDKFFSYHLGELYNIKDDYLSFDDGKLIKGRYKKGPWFISWDKKNSTYVINKS